MNSIRDTELFTPMNKVFKLETTLSGNLEPYRVPKEYYSHFFVTFRNYRHSLAKYVLDNLKSERIIPIIFRDPIQPAEKITIPYPICTFLKMEEKTIVSYVDLSEQAKFFRDKSNSRETTGLNIDELFFYSYCQTAALNLILKDYSAKILNTKIPKLVSELYSIMLTKCIDAKYSISINRTNTDILRYLCASYCLQHMFEMDSARASKMALDSKLLDKESVIQNSKVILREQFEMKTIMDFVNYIMVEFPTVKKGALPFRTLVLIYNKMYGYNTSFSLEHGFSFINMILTSRMQLKFFSDMYINKVADRYSREIEKSLADLIYR